MAAGLGLLLHTPALAQSSGRDRVIENQGHLFVCHQGQDSDIVDDGHIDSETQLRYRLLAEDMTMEGLAATFFDLDGTVYRADMSFTGRFDISGGDATLVIEKSNLTRADPLPDGSTWSSSTGSLEMTGSGDNTHLDGSLYLSSGDAIELKCKIHNE